MVFAAVNKTAKTQSSTATSSSDSAMTRSIKNCHLCLYSTNSPANLRRHLLTHTGEKPFACDTCDYRTTQEISLQRHINHVHNGEDREKTKCPECHKVVISWHLKRHRLIHSNERNYCCHKCNFKAKDASALNHHTNQVHNNSRPFACGYSGCHKRFKTRADARQHERCVHLKIRIYGCHVCDRKFFNKTILTKHMKTHIRDGHQHGTCGHCMKLNIESKRSQATKESFRRKLQSREELDEGTETSTQVGDKTEPKTKDLSLNSLFTKVHHLMQLLPRNSNCSSIESLSPQVIELD